MAGVTSVVIDGTTYLVDDINAVDFSEDQGLSEQQQEQGRSNIGAAAETALEDKADEADLDALEGTVGELSDDVDGLTEALADKADVIVDTASGAIASFPDGAAVAAKDITIAIEPVQSGSGDPSPTNVRPITGWTGANVTRTGKNLLKNTAISNTINGVTFTVNPDGSVIVNGTATANIYFLINNTVFLKAGTYTLSGTPANIPKYCYIYDDNDFGGWRDENGAGITKAIGSDTTGRIYICITSGATLNNAVFYPMIEAGTIKTNYKPYTGTTIPISWQSEAGTVYGGTLDVTTGLLTVDKKQAVFDGSESWSYVSSGQRFVITMSDIKTTYGSSANDVLCNELGKNTSAQWALNHYNYQLWVEKSGITSLEDFKSWLNQNNLQVVYPLGTPQTYQLTPTEVDLLLGDNNVWADTGDSTVAYRADTKLYIQKINAPTDDDMIADAQIASGKYFIIGGNLYKSTTTIPAGDIITPGSNCILTNLADALNALNT